MYTTKSKALSVGLVLLSVPVSAWAQTAVPTPESVLGFQVGADFKLATYDQSLGYFRQLDAASDRMQLVEVGRTSEGKAWYFALISTPENLGDVERYRTIAQRLAHPQGLTDDEARRLAREGKPFVHIDGGLHASEVAGAQHTIQLAYDLVSATDDPKIQAILDNVVVLLWPSLNPDGQNIVVNWYRSNVGTPYEAAPLKELYQKYIGHDNNRDAYMLNMVESRVITRTWRHWEPQIIHVHHQSSPFPTRIWLPPFAEPIASQAPPIISRTINMIGMAMAQGLEANGQPGATHMGTGFDAWYPGYIDYLPVFQNIAAYWTETALYRYATPHFYTMSDFPESRRDLRVESLYPSPWQGGWWRLRDAVEYMLTASMSVLDYAAKYDEELLYNRYQTGRNTIAKYEREPPYAYFIPQDQRDPVAPVELLRRLAFNGVRVHQLNADVTFDRITYPSGTWVVPMDQEFAEYARQVLDVQAYPDLREFPDGPPEQPYDAAGWTLPYQMDVRVQVAASPLTDDVRSAMTMLNGTATDWSAGELEPDVAGFDSPPGVGFDTDANAAGIVPPAGRITGSGSRLAVDPAQNNSYRLLNRALAAGGTVRFETGTPGDSGASGSSGRYVIAGVSQTDQAQWVSELAVRATRTNNVGGPAVRPRIGLYRPWRASMDEGWTRWLFEQYGFQFSSVTNADIRAGSLGERFDVILMAADSRNTIVDGFAKGSVPPRYEGGIGATGVRAVDRFVRSGGTLVTLNQSSAFAIEDLHLPVKNVVGELPRRDFFVSGSLLEVTTDPAHPVMAGMPERAKVFVDRSPVFTTLEGFEGTALAKYSKQGSPLLSGYLLGEEHLQGYAAALDVHHGDGHVVLIGFRPQWRGQPFGTFRVLFNAALYGGELAAASPDSTDFWTAPVAESDSSSAEAKNGR